MILALLPRSSDAATAALDWLYETAAQALRGTHGEFAAIRRRGRCVRSAGKGVAAFPADHLTV